MLKKNYKTLNVAFYNLLYLVNVLDKTLKDIQVVYDSITERLFRSPGPRTNYFVQYKIYLDDN